MNMETLFTIWNKKWMKIGDESMKILLWKTGQKILIKLSAEFF